MNNFETQLSQINTPSELTEQDILLERIAAALQKSSTECASVISSNAPVMSDMGSILIQLTEAVAQAKSEVEHERTLRLALQAENQHLLMSTSSQYGSPSCYNTGLSPSVNDDALTTSGITTTTTTADDYNMTLNEVLSYISSLPPHIQDGVYMSYYGSGLNELDYSNISRIIKPIDFPSLVFIIFIDYSFVSSHTTSATIGGKSVVVSSGGLVQFSYDALQSLLTSTNTISRGAGAAATAVQVSSSRVVDESVSSAAVTSTADEEPRMNLLEALNVQSDEDVVRIVTVRKCHKLGFKSHIFLKQYFSRFGKVERVVLLPMRAKPNTGGASTDTRGNRPSSMGFVVMEKSDMVDKILSFDNCSGVHIIKGWPIEVRNFVKPADRPCDLIASAVGGASAAPIITTPSSYELAESLWK